MNQLLDPFIGLLTREERISYRLSFIRAMLGLLLVLISLFALIPLIIHMKFMGLFLGLIAIALAVGYTLWLVDKKDAYENKLLHEARHRFIDNLFLQHGVIPGVKPPVLDKRSKYLTDKNEEIYGIASLDPSGYVELARY